MQWHLTSIIWSNPSAQAKTFLYLLDILMFSIILLNSNTCSCLWAEELDLRFSIKLMSDFLFRAFNSVSILNIMTWSSPRHTWLCPPSTIAVSNALEIQNILKNFKNCTAFFKVMWTYISEKKNILAGEYRSCWPVIVKLLCGCGYMYMCIYLYSIFVFITNILYKYITNIHPI